tara:strand:- start:131511 stop:132017 length:507 start_codon:yes stop_codon:yes gene_type:complete
MDNLIAIVYSLGACLPAVSLILFLAHKQRKKKKVSEEEHFEDPNVYINEMKTQELIAIIERTALEGSKMWMDWGFFGSSGDNAHTHSRLALELENDVMLFIDKDGSAYYRNSHSEKSNSYVEVTLPINPEMKARLQSVFNWIMVERIRVSIENALMPVKKEGIDVDTA